MFDHPLHILRIESVPVLFNPLQQKDRVDLLRISDISIVEFYCFSLRIKDEKSGKIFFFDVPIVFEGSLRIQSPVLAINVHQGHKVVIGHLSQLVFNVNHCRKVVIIEEV